MTEILKSRRTKTPYVSCIKINGVPILPPLITEEKRREIHDIRLRVAEVEKRIREKKAKDICMVQEIPKIKLINTLEQQLALNESDNLDCDKNDTLPEFCSFYEYNNPNISNTEVENINRISDCDDTICNEETNTQNDTKMETEPEVPRLIRSNSYTLESPSPLLVAYLKKQKEGPVNNDKEDTQFDTPVLQQMQTRDVEDLETDLLKGVIENNFTTTKKTADGTAEIESELKQILNNIPEKYSKEILAIFQKVKSSKEEEAEYSTIRRSRCLSEGAINNTESPTFGTSNVSFMTSSQTLYYSITDSSNNTPDTLTVKVNDVLIGPKVLPLARKLFPSTEKTAQEQRIEWAASKIGAVAKGYLVRRLMRTDKVQGLIQMLKDAVVCAFELHQAEDFQPSDVELHRRLLQQVSTVCYTFYEIFFEISTTERMAIIAQDRQRKLDKMKRSLTLSTRPNSSSKSQNRSTPRSVQRKYVKNITV